MGLVTRCPTCKTLFRLEPEYLVDSGGWARCGVCGESFDSSRQRYQAIEPPVAEAVQVESPPGEPLALDGAAQYPVIHPADQADTLRAEPALDGASLSPAIGRFSDHLLLAQQSFATADKPGFLSTGQPTRSGGRLSRVVLGTFAAMLTLCLVFQVAIHERGFLSSRFPALETSIKLLCSSPVCQATPSRHGEALVIDSSSLVTIPDGGYRLSLTVKNASERILAIPSLELSLTDAMEEVIVRRVLSPQELGASHDQLLPGRQWSPSATLRVDLSADTGSFKGYRVLAFYP